jgi:predicted kinase
MPGSDQPLHVVLVTGPPASGKTTVGRELARYIDAALVDQDTATAPLTAVVADLLGVRDLDDQRLAGPTREARYETVTALAEDNLRAGLGVVLVAPFSAERRDLRAWDALDGRLRAAGGSPLLVWLRLDAATVVQRLRARGEGRDAAKLADPDAFTSALDVAEPAVPHLAIDAGGSTGEILRDILAALAG